MTYQVDYLYGWSSAGTDYEGKVIGQADRAISAAPDDPNGYYAKSTYLRMSHRANEAIEVADAGLAKNPNSAQLYQARSSAEVALGRFDQAISDAEQAIRLGPRDPQVGLRYVIIGDAEVGLGRLDVAIEEYRKAIVTGYRNRVVNMAGAYALQGKMDEAKSVLAEALRANPKLTVKMRTERFAFLRSWRKGCARPDCRRNERDPESSRQSWSLCRRARPGADPSRSRSWNRTGPAPHDPTSSRRECSMSLETELLAIEETFWTVG
jgi:tetratricopeptide (TPR) repeat protein